MAEQFANGGSSTLASGISDSAAELTVVSATGFSTEATFRLQLTSASGGTNVEIVEVTAVDGSTFTVTRAAEAFNGVQEAYAWDEGDYVSQVLTEAALAAIPVGGDASGTVSHLTVVSIGGVDVSLADGSTGDVVTQQSDGSFAPQAAGGGGSSPLARTYLSSAMAVYPTAGAWALVDSTTTISLTAPSSGEVVFELLGGMLVLSSIGQIAFAIATHGDLTPLSDIATLPEYSPTWTFSMVFKVTGLASGDAYQFDLIWYAAQNGWEFAWGGGSAEGGNPSLSLSAWAE